jgi:hypothetical protein
MKMPVRDERIEKISKMSLEDRKLLAKRTTEKITRGVAERQEKKKKKGT